jgi:hypothetical protein
MGQTPDSTINADPQVEAPPSLTAAGISSLKESADIADAAPANNNDIENIALPNKEVKFLLKKSCATTNLKNPYMTVFNTNLEFSKQLAILGIAQSNFQRKIFSKLGSRQTVPLNQLKVCSTVTL